MRNPGHLPASANFYGGNVKRFILTGLLASFLLATGLTLPQRATHAQGKQDKKNNLAKLPTSNGQPAGGQAAGEFGSVESITAEQLKGFLTFLASDELEGRDTPSRGLDTAAKFVAFNLSRWGFK